MLSACGHSITNNTTTKAHGIDPSKVSIHSRKSTPCSQAKHLAAPHCCLLHSPLGLDLTPEPTITPHKAHGIEPPRVSADLAFRWSLESRLLVDSRPDAAYSSSTLLFVGGDSDLHFYASGCASTLLTSSPSSGSDWISPDSAAPESSPPPAVAATDCIQAAMDTSPASVSCTRPHNR